MISTSPYRYTDWYLPLIDAGKSMPDAIGEGAPEEAAPTEGAPLTPTDAMSSGGDGIVTEEQVQKGYVWMNEVNNNIFDATYEDKEGWNRARLSHPADRFVPESHSMQLWKFLRLVSTF